MVVTDYAGQGEDWQKIAREQVFPGMNDRLPAIDGAYQTLSGLLGPIEDKVRAYFAFGGPVCNVLYIGIGNGAGWVTTYDGKRAVLYGLEGIVDSGFHEPARLEGLVAHELGHVVHHTWRESRGLELGSGPWWQLYEEGFAQRCESEVLTPDNWHMRSPDRDDDWLAWCQANRAWLAAEFVQTVDQGQDTRTFFGSWFELRGRKQTGYFLGHQVISYLVESMPLSEIALLEPGPMLAKTMRATLEVLAASTP
jgi:hypothetical protein